VDLQQLDHKLRLLEQVQPVVPLDTHHVQDPGGFVIGDADVRHAAQRQLAGAANPFETVQQEPSVRCVHSFQRLPDTACGDRRQQARFASGLTHPVSFITQVQRRDFDGRAHRVPLRAGAG